MTIDRDIMQNACIQTQYYSDESVCFGKVRLQPFNVLLKSK